MCLKVGHLIYVCMCMHTYHNMSGTFIFNIYFSSFLQPESRGTVNGIGQSLVAVGRSVGPILASSVFAWSASNGELILYVFLRCVCPRVCVCVCVCVCVVCVCECVCVCVCVAILGMGEWAHAYVLICTCVCVCTIYMH